MSGIHGEFACRRIYLDGSIMRRMQSRLHTWRRTNTVSKCQRREEDEEKQKNYPSERFLCLKSLLCLFVFFPPPTCNCFCRICFMVSYLIPIYYYYYYYYYYFLFRPVITAATAYLSGVCLCVAEKQEKLRASVRGIRRRSGIMPLHAAHHGQRRACASCGQQTPPCIESSGCGSGEGRRRAQGGIHNGGYFSNVGGFVTKWQARKHSWREKSTQLQCKQKKSKNKNTKRKEKKE
ncbi:hypothetical protein MOQ_006348, partial [Trypanosoma cruzi marinkellei]